MKETTEMKTKTQSQTRSQRTQAGYGEQAGWRVPGHRAAVAVVALALTFARALFAPLRTVPAPFRKCA